MSLIFTCGLQSEIFVSVKMSDIFAICVVLGVIFRLAFYYIIMNSIYSCIRCERSSFVI
jgi:hypothetical protein